jgi:hypothetical protein
MKNQVKAALQNSPLKGLSASGVYGLRAFFRHIAPKVLREIVPLPACATGQAACR